jgi:hypothetical protein
MDADLEGKLLVTEIIAVSALGIVFASSGNDPDMSKARAVLDFIRANIGRAADERQFSDDAKFAAHHYADEVLSQVLENLHFLRGGSR